MVGGNRIGLAGAWTFALALALIALLAGCRRDPCGKPTYCCATCDDKPQLSSSCFCGPNLTPVDTCPSRSSCALTYFVGSGPASCCQKSCNAPAYYQSNDNTCDAGDVYIHECPEESACYQSYRASLTGGVYEGWREEASGSDAPLLTVWGASTSDVWAAGTQGRLLHRVDGTWRSIESPTTSNLTGLWGSGNNDVWAVGWSGTAIHYDGTRWTLVVLPTQEHLFAVAGASATSIWAAGQNGTVLHFDGAQWNVETVPETHDFLAIAVQGGAVPQVWIAGQLGKVIHFDGTRWSSEKTPNEVAIHALGIGDNRDLWGSGDSGTLLARQSGEWRILDYVSDSNLMGVSAAGGVVHAVGNAGVILRYSDDQLKRVTYFFNRVVGVDLLGAWGRDSDLWAVGTWGTILHLSEPTAP